MPFPYISPFHSYSRCQTTPPFQIYFGSTQSYSGQRLQGHRSTICFPIIYSQIHRTVSPYSGLSHPHFSLNLLGVRHLETLAFETVLHSSQEPCFRVYTTNEDRPRSFGKVLPWVDMHSTQPLYRSVPYWTDFRNRTPRLHKWTVFSELHY